MTTTMNFQAMFTARQTSGKRNRFGLMTGGRGRTAVAARSTVMAGEAGARAERLARLRREIAAGTYFVSSQDVAESVMRSMWKS